MPSAEFLDRAGTLIAAAVLAGLVGYERERRERHAGLRTHMLVGIGACVFTILMASLIDRFDNDNVRADPIRIVSSITSGIAFLAAGAIIHANGEIKGLTTGASLWVAGAVRLACGLGEFALASFTVLITLVILRVLKKVE